MGQFFHEFIVNIAKGSNSSSKQIVKLALDSSNYNEIKHRKEIEDAVKNLLGPTARIVGGILSHKKL